MCDLTSELLWLWQWCAEAGIATFDQEIPVHDNNKDCVNTACGKRNFNMKRMKHVEIQLHFAKEEIIASKIALQYTPTSDILSDFLKESVGGSTLAHVRTALVVLSLGERGGVRNHDPPPAATHHH
ncbi:hypothetical protein O181_027572 [Austropuccinia psidii MF-1]|uniref:Uncharacterized protein n=1 Tax=Austropuccinia psidii MF-1 TaxID=1389203 RepID=A0A9Q3H1T8_9BASI|nr:hypothetical protein [Austropuccinia psidii MF-1]